MGHFDDDKCFECGITEDIQHHHVVPASRGGTKTVPLCENCHRLAHHRKRKTKGSMSHSQLIKEGIRKRIESGQSWGTPDFGRWASPLGVAATKRRAAEHNQKVYDIVSSIMSEEGIKLGDVVNRLADMGIKTRQGKPYTYHNLYRVLKSYKKTLDD